MKGWLTYFNGKRESLEELSNEDFSQMIAKYYFFVIFKSQLIRATWLMNHV